MKLTVTTDCEESETLPYLSAYMLFLFNIHVDVHVDLLELIL